MSNRKKTEYERIRDIWYDKLKEEGFKDVEQDIGRKDRNGSRGVNWVDPELRQAVQDYYCMAQCFLNEYEFDSELERVIWEYHTEGLSIRSIVKLLNQISTEKTNRIRIWKIVKKLEDTMKAQYLSV